ncbi:sigma 54-interacting transcriptional regulator [bacterium]|nr:sigma 54-interacting transcriptional regulator [bacterium]
MPENREQDRRCAVLCGMDPSLSGPLTVALHALDWPRVDAVSLGEALARPWNPAEAALADTRAGGVKVVADLLRVLPEGVQVAVLALREELPELMRLPGGARVVAAVRTGTEPGNTERLTRLLRLPAPDVSAEEARPDSPALDSAQRVELLQERLQRKDFEIRILIEACEKISSSLQVGEVVRFIQESARRMMNAESSSVILVDSSGLNLYIATSTGDKEERVKGLRFPVDKGIAGWVFGHGRPLVVNDVGRDMRFYPQIDQLSGFRTRAIAAAPMILRGRIIGVVEVLNQAEARGFPDDRIELFCTFANLAALALDNAISFDTLSQNYHLLLNEQMRHDGLEQSENEAMRRVYELCRQVAPLESTVLLQGDSGTGKELLADLIHRLSGRSDKPMIKVNIAALPENLVESELFGHEKGSFTGALARATGKFEQADRGTIFLDEIGELRPDVQVKLLRFLQEHTFERIGGKATLKVDVRIIAATNRELRKAVAEGQFRKDLFYRLNVVPVFVPLLRERREDIPPLVDFFIRKFNGELNRKVSGIDPEALACLSAYPWPGNIRELENIIERILVMKSSGVIRIEDIPAEISTPALQPAEPTAAAETAAAQMTGRGMWEVERELIERTLRENAFNQSRTARILGISLNQLRYRIGKFRIEVRK